MQYAPKLKATPAPPSEFEITIELEKTVNDLKNDILKKTGIENGRVIFLLFDFYVLRKVNLL